MGGVSFSVSMLVAQIFPFVALQLYDGENQETITAFLAGSATFWMALNATFFCTINLSYLDTFFGTTTASQYTCELFKTSNDDSMKYDAIFSNRLSFTKSINEEVQEWVGANVARWKAENPTWFRIELIPDDFLPTGVLQTEGGARRRRSSVSLRSIVGMDEKLDKRRVNPAL